MGDKAKPWSQRRPRSKKHKKRMHKRHSEKPKMAQEPPKIPFEVSAL